MNKWNEFKNYMHNDLKITREDIQSWMAEAIVQESRRIVKGYVDEIDVNVILRDQIKSMITESSWNDKDELKQEFVDSISKEIASKIKVSI